MEASRGSGSRDSDKPNENLPKKEKSDPSGNLGANNRNEANEAAVPVPEQENNQNQNEERPVQQEPINNPNPEQNPQQRLPRPGPGAFSAEWRNLCEGFQDFLESSGLDFSSNRPVDKWICKIEAAYVVKGILNFRDKMDLEFDTKERAESYAREWVQREYAERPDMRYEVIVRKKDEVEPCLVLTNKQQSVAATGEQDAKKPKMSDDAGGALD